MKHKISYMFTNKKHSKRGVMSTVLGTISIVSIIVAVYLTFLQKGVAAFNYGIVILLSTLFALIGVWLGVVAKTEKERFYVFAYIGIVLNSIVLVTVSFILYAGAYGV